MIERSIIILAGFVLDCFVGDPHGLWHPVQGIGWLINRTEEGLRRFFRLSEAAEEDRRRKYFCGGLLVLIVLLAAGGAAAGLLNIAALIHPWLARALSVVLCCQCLAARSLRAESAEVERALRRKDLPGARQAVSMIVGRDVSVLDEAGVARAAVETVAENTSDGVIAPLFYLILFGIPGGVLYKAVNTMDSMIGYRNDRYRYFGTAAARLDDLANYIPSRLAALLMILAAAVLPGMSGRRALAVWRRDRRKHKSPNSAQTESACAGALGLRLAGDAVYFGRIERKDYIGDRTREIEAADITRAGRLMYLTSGLMLLIGVLALCACACFG